MNIGKTLVARRTVAVRDVRPFDQYAENEREGGAELERSVDGRCESRRTTESESNRFCIIISSFSLQLDLRSQVDFKHAMFFENNDVYNSPYTFYSPRSKK